MSSAIRSAAVALIGVGALLTAAAPAGSITGGTDDDPRNPTHPEVGMVFFYQPDGRFRCSGTLVHPRVLLTAAHCTYGDIGKVAVTFDTDVAADAAAGRAVLPRAIDDEGYGLQGSGYDEGLWIVEYDAAGDPVLDADGEVVREEYDPDTAPDSSADGAPEWITGTALTHPEYSDFTDMDNWNDTGVVLLDEPAVGVPVVPIAPAGYLDRFTQEELVETLFRTVGYGTEVRQADTGPQSPTPMSYPLRRQYTDEKGQKLTPQILQMNGNEHDPFGGGGTCFGDSGGPAFHGGYVVGDTSYGYTNNCRYLGGYQRVDIPVVRDWLTCVLDVAGEVRARTAVSPDRPTPGASSAATECGTLLP